MSVDGADLQSDLSQFGRELQPETGIRRRLAPGKSIASPFYLIVFGVIATWTIGVFFGVGFFSLVHHSEKTIAGTGDGDPALGIDPRSAEKREAPQSTTGKPAPAIVSIAESIAPSP